MAPPPVIVFDLDDTLYLERDFAFSGYGSVGRLVHAAFGVPDFAARCRALFEAGERRRVFDRALAACGIAPTPGLVARLVAHYREHEPAISLAPDAESYLEGARARRVRLALVTDGHPLTQANKIAAMGLGRFIRRIRCTGAWGRDYWKPHPRAFEEVERVFRARGDDIVYVADNPGKDFIAPNRLGWRTVQVARPGRIHTGPPPRDDHAAASVVSCLDELEAVLGA